METKKLNILLTIITIISMMGISYLSISFYKLDLSPINWGSGGRLTFLLMCVACISFTPLVYLSFKNDLL